MSKIVSPEMESGAFDPWAPTPSLINVPHSNYAERRKTSSNSNGNPINLLSSEKEKDNKLSSSSSSSSSSFKAENQDSEHEIARSILDILSFAETMINEKDLNENKSLFIEFYEDDKTRIPVVAVNAGFLSVSSYFMKLLQNFKLTEEEILKTNGLRLVNEGKMLTLQAKIPCGMNPNIFIMILLYAKNLMYSINCEPIAANLWTSIHGLPRPASNQADAQLQILKEKMKMKFLQTQKPNTYDNLLPSQAMSAVMKHVIQSDPYSFYSASYIMTRYIRDGSLKAMYPRGGEFFMSTSGHKGQFVRGAKLGEFVPDPNTGKLMFREEPLYDNGQVIVMEGRSVLKYEPIDNPLVRLAAVDSAAKILGIPTLSRLTSQLYALHHRGFLLTIPLNSAIDDAIVRFEETERQDWQYYKDTILGPLGSDSRVITTPSGVSSTPAIFSPIFVIKRFFLHAAVKEVSIKMQSLLKKEEDNTLGEVGDSLQTKWANLFPTAEGIFDLDPLRQLFHLPAPMKEDLASNDNKENETSSSVANEEGKKKKKKKKKSSTTAGTADPFANISQTKKNGENDSSKDAQKEVNSNNGPGKGKGKKKNKNKESSNNNDNDNDNDNHDNNDNNDNDSSNNSNDDGNNEGNDSNSNSYSLNLSEELKDLSSPEITDQMKAILDSNDFLKEMWELDDELEFIDAKEHVLKNGSRNPVLEERATLSAMEFLKTKSLALPNNLLGQHPKDAILSLQQCPHGINQSKWAAIPKDQLQDYCRTMDLLLFERLLSNLGNEKSMTKSETEPLMSLEDITKRWPQVGEVIAPSFSPNNNQSNNSKKNKGGNNRKPGRIGTNGTSISDIDFDAVARRLFHPFA